MDILHDNPRRTFSVPLLTDSSTAIVMMPNEKETKRTKHIERRWMYIQDCCLKGLVILYHVNGERFQLADLGTKNIPNIEAKAKLLFLEVDTRDDDEQDSLN
jgi:hypothetical protein